MPVRSHPTTTIDEFAGNSTLSSVKVILAKIHRSVADFMFMPRHSHLRADTRWRA
jgi:hypothetical protein